MVVGCRVRKAARPVVGDDDRRDMAAAGIVIVDHAARLRRTRNAVVFAVFIPREDDRRIAGTPDGRCLDRIHDQLHVRVSTPHELSVIVVAAIRRRLRLVDAMHFVALVRNDQRERRDASALEVRIERTEADEFLRQIRVLVYRSEIGEAGVLRGVKCRRRGIRFW